MTNDTPTHVSGSSHWSHLVTLPADHESVETGQLHCPEQSKIHSVYSGFASLSNQSPYRSASHSFVFKNPNYLFLFRAYFQFQPKTMSL